MLNFSSLVEIAQNKLASFQAMSHEEVSIPKFSPNIQDAREWIEEGATVVCRTLLRGSEGRGIVLAASNEELVRAPLYVKYVKKQDEYRIHIMAGQVIDQQQKRRSREVADEDVDWKVRNHSNGFIFAREGCSPPPMVVVESLKAMASLSLDFGAVDVIWNAHEQKAYVLEINTAPGLEGTTLESYSNGFRTLF